MKILITGATGLLGKVLIKKLLKENYQVIGISLKSIQDKIFLNNEYYNHYCLDLKNKKKLKFFINKLEPTIIFHLAAYIPKFFDQQSYHKSYKNNFLCTKNLLEVTGNIKSLIKIIFISSISVYNNNNITLVQHTESSPQKPNNFYGIHKLKSETECISWSKKYKKKLIIIRFPGLHGYQRQSGVIFNFYKSATLDNTIKVDKTNNFFSFLFINDAVNICFLAMKERFLLEKLNIYNVGGNKIISLGDLAKKIKNLFFPNKVLIKENDNSLVNYSVLSNAKVKKELKWVCNSFDNNLKKTINYWRKHSNE